MQWDAMYVRLLDPHTGELLREHLSQKRGGHRIPTRIARGSATWNAGTAGSCSQGR